MDIKNSNFTAEEKFYVSAVFLGIAIFILSIIFGISFFNSLAYSLVSLFFSAAVFGAKFGSSSLKKAEASKQAEVVYQTCYPTLLKLVKWNLYIFSLALVIVFLLEFVGLSKSVSDYIDDHRLVDFGQLTFYAFDLNRYGFYNVSLFMDVYVFCVLLTNVYFLFNFIICKRSLAIELLRLGSYRIRIKNKIMLKAEPYLKIHALSFLCLILLFVISDTLFYSRHIDEYILTHISLNVGLVALDLDELYRFLRNIYIVVSVCVFWIYLPFLLLGGAIFFSRIGSTLLYKEPRRDF